MKQSEPVAYTEKIPDYGDVMTVKSFKEAVLARAIIDYDGTGHPVKDGKMCRKVEVNPSRLNELPTDATHVIWFGR